MPATDSARVDRARRPIPRLSPADPKRRRPGPALRWILAAVMLGAATAAAAQVQPDAAYFKNGDRLTGEIQSLDRGKLSFDTPATGVVQIQWDEIARLVSSTNYEVVLDNGQRLYGSLADTDRPDEIRLERRGVALDLPMLQIVRMTPIESTVVERIDMNINLGYSLAKANNLAQTQAGYDFRYRTEERQVRLSFDASTSTSASEPTSTRIYTNLAFRRFFDDRNWNPFGVAQLERNDELGIKRRATAGGGMSRWLRDTNSSRIALGGGIVYSQETGFDSPDTTSDASAMIATELEWFRYDQPELDVSTQLTLFKRLSGSRETRGNLDVSFRWEIFKDFFWGFSVYYSFDKQLGATDSSTDYGSFTSLGWKF
jgi:Protein of unknown function, DUF481